MRRSTLFLLVVLFGSWLSGFGQNAPKLTSPRIVATFERLGQTTDIPTTTLFTPKHWGTYQVSIVMVETSAGGDGYWVGRCNWIDGSGPDGFSVNLGTTYPNATNTVFAARVKRGTPFQFSTSQSMSPGGKYNVWVVVEQLM